MNKNTYAYEEITTFSIIWTIRIPRIITQFTYFNIITISIFFHFCFFNYFIVEPCIFSIIFNFIIISINRII